jgi:splicing factor 3A subunit 1
MQASPPAAGIGIIVPPPGVRAVAEKTARAVAARPPLEARIREKHGADPKFAFIRPGDPYHAFYRAQVDAAAREAAQQQNGTGHAAVAADGSAAPPGTADSSGGAGTGPPSTAKIQPAAAPPEAKIDSNGPAAGLVSEPAVEEGPNSATTGAAPAVSKLNVARVRADRARPVPKDPPPEDIFSVVDVIPTPSHLALDVIKLAAQFAARHGSQFVHSLTNREFRNPLFDFLKPMHPHAVVFQHLIEAYAAVLHPPIPRSELSQGLEAEAATRKPALDKSWYLHDWKALQHAKGAETGASAAALEQAGAAVAPIDWHDFVVLETIDIEDSDSNLPAPIADPTQIPRIMAAADAARQVWEKNRLEVDMDMDMDGDDDDITRGPIGAGHSAEGGHVVTADVEADIPQNLVRKTVARQEAPARTVFGISDFAAEQRLGSATPDAQAVVAGNELSSQRPGGPEQGRAGLLVSAARGASASAKASVADVSVMLPDGQIVPMSEATPAMRAQLLDPKYKEERMRAAQKHQRQNLADGDEIALHLARLNRDKPTGGVYRHWGVQDEPAAEPSVAPEALAASSQTPLTTATGPTRPPAVHTVADSSNSEANDLPPAKRARVDAAVGALTAAAGKNLAATTARAQPSLQGVENNEDLPAALRGLETPAGLISENEWMTKVGDKVNICVKIPVHPSKDWLLKGQEINMEVPLKSTVLKLKDALAKVVKIPANKQKLQFGAAGFLKDRLSLAFYNVDQGGTIALEVKERGGRAKR